VGVETLCARGGWCALPAHLGCHENVDAVDVVDLQAWWAEEERADRWVAVAQDPSPVALPADSGVVERVL
jgi:hypothetical protein